MMCDFCPQRGPALVLILTYVNILVYHFFTSKLGLRIGKTLPSHCHSFHALDIGFLWALSCSRVTRHRLLFCFKYQWFVSLSWISSPYSSIYSMMTTNMNMSVKFSNFNVS